MKDLMKYINQIHVSSSQFRLDKLIEERLKPGANQEEIDAQIWDLFGETWAIMFTDLSGFSRSVAEFGIIHFLQLMYESQRIFTPCIDRYNGILLKVEGDSMLVVFRNVKKAVECAIAMQRAAHEYNKNKPPEETLLLCIGLGYGKVLKIGDADVFGAEVNAASKLGEDTAKAWEILGTGTVARSIKDMPGISLKAIPTVPPGAKQAFKINYSL